MSLVDRRRRQQHHPQQQQQLAQQRRRLFASNRSPITTVESESPSQSTSVAEEMEVVEDEGGSPRLVTFDVGDDSDDKENDSRGSVTEAADNRLNIRRGSAPGDLLLAQLGSRSLSSSSRENSPTSTVLKPCRVIRTPLPPSGAPPFSPTGRRGSLPADLLEQGPLLLAQQPLSSCAPFSNLTICGKNSRNGNGQSAGHRRRTRLGGGAAAKRRASGGPALDVFQALPLHVSTSSPQRLNEMGMNGSAGAASRARHALRRGSAPLVTVCGGDLLRLERARAQQDSATTATEDVEEEDASSSMPPPPPFDQVRRRGSLPSALAAGTGGVT